MAAAGWAGVGACVPCRARGRAAGAGHDVEPLRIPPRPLREDGVVRAFLPGAVGVSGAQDDLAVPIPRADFDAHEVVVFPPLEEMRPLYPDGTLLYVRTRAQDFGVAAHHTVAFRVELQQADGAFTLVASRGLRGGVVYDVGAIAALLEVERGVYAVHFGQIDRLAPPLRGVFALDEEIAAPYIRGNHVERLVPFIIGDGGREDAARHGLPRQWQL